MKVFIFDLDDTLFDSSGRSDTDEKYHLIKPFEGVKEVLSELDGRAILVTRGDRELQTKKIEVLGLGPHFHDIHICKTDEGKLEIFRTLSEVYKGKELIVIGNRIDCEIRYGKMLGFKTIHLKHGKYSVLNSKDHFEIADIEIEKFGQIKKHLNIK